MNVSDYAKQLVEKALELHTQYVTLSTKFESLRDEFQLLRQSIHQYEERWTSEVRQHERRLTALEADFQAVIKASVKDAVVQLYREQKLPPAAD